MQSLAGRWKVPILDLLATGDRHFAAIERALPPISRRMLARSLRELEHDRLVERRPTDVPGGTVTYHITGPGRHAITVIDALLAPQHCVDENRQ